MKIYLAGPMRGYTMFNFPAFIRAAMDLRSFGHFVLNPAERDLAEGFDPSKSLTDPANLAVFDLKTAFEWDFTAIMNSDAIVMLPGWEKSKGVQGELVLAMALQRKVYEWDALGSPGENLVPLGIESYTVDFTLVSETVPPA